VEHSEFRCVLDGAELKVETASHTKYFNLAARLVDEIEMISLFTLIDAAVLDRHR